jgi:hypothetical protein
LRSDARLLLVLLAPALLASKCISYDDAFGPTDAAPLPDASSDGGPPATACADPGEAHVLIVDSSFRIQCGCREPAGRVCTISAGTTVVWRFADSLEHNVSSAFGSSDEQLVGTFRHTFAAPGVHSYGCTVHPAVMSGYTIVVE